MVTGAMRHIPIWLAIAVTSTPTVIHTGVAR